jgi:uncharacterized GH25 family protein
MASLALLVPGVAPAHDFWIMPSRFAAAAGAAIELDLRVGDAFPGESYPRDPRHVRRFVVAGTTSGVEVGGRAGAVPAGRTTSPGGPLVVAYYSRPTWTELAPGAFDSYLFSVGLDDLVGERAARGESHTPGRERFVRCAKALVGDADGIARDVGMKLPFEIRARALPSPDSPHVEVLLLFRGRPLPRALVRALSPRVPDAPPTVRTDASGRARFGPLGSGVWVIAATHATRLRHDRRADWGSYWASLSLMVP